MKPGDWVKAQVDNYDPVFGEILYVYPHDVFVGERLVRVKVTIKTDGKPYSRPQYHSFHEKFITVVG